MTATGVVASSDWDLWSTTARVCVTDPSALEAARGVADGILVDVEKAASRFRTDSEVSSLPVGWSRISPTLAALLSVALEAATRSAGAVDPTLGGAMRAIGYDRDIALVRVSAASGRSWSRVAGWESLMLDGRHVFVPEGVEIDLGATAKAVAADWCANAIVESTGSGALVCLGGDVATAGEPPPGGWQVAIRDTDDDPACQVTLSAGAAIATSSTVRRSWGAGSHHILDPETGRPVDPFWRSASVVAPTCAQANTISTAAIVKGECAVTWVSALDRPARLVDRDRRVVLLNGWPEERGV
jgi:thiamine biosynthesis lipoprotein